MHAFSNMRRNSSYKNFIDIALFIFFLLVYDALSSMYIFLPPLFGILFLSFVKLYQAKRYYSFFAFILTLCILEATKGLYPGILLVVYSLVYIFAFNLVVKMFKYFNVFEVLYIPLVYFLLLVLNSFVAIKNSDVVFFSPMIMLYIVLEIVILVIRWILNIK